MKIATRAYLWPLAGFFVGGVMISYASQPKPPAKVPDVVRAHKFELIDEKGTERATLGYGNNGTVFGIHFLNKGKPTALFLIGVQDDGSQVMTMSNLKANTHVRITLPADDQPRFELNGKEGKGKLITVE